MGYLIGAGPLDPAVKRYNGGGSSFTMDNSGTTNGTLLWVDGVAQCPGTDYSVSGTTISTTSATGSGTNNVTSLQLFNTGLINTPADNTVDGSKTKDALIADYSDVTITAADLIMYGDATDSNNTKRDTVQGILDLAGGFTQGTEVATTSGTTITFSSIPTGVDMIVLNLENVGFSSDVGIDLVLGDGGGVEGSGYLSGGVSIQGSSTTAVAATTDRFELTSAQGSASMGWHGSVILTLKDSSNNTWIANWCIYTDTATIRIGWGAGSKSLSAVLTQIQLSGGTFDQGSANIMYQ